MADDAKSWFEEEIEKMESDPDFHLEDLLLRLNIELHESMDDTGVSKVELARRLGRSPSYVTRLLDGQRNVTLKTLVQVAHALGAQVYLHIRQPGLEWAPFALSGAREFNANPLAKPTSLSKDAIRAPLTSGSLSAVPAEPQSRVVPQYVPTHPTQMEMIV